MISIINESETYGAKLRVVGVGGGGCNAVNSMIMRGLVGVEFIAANTDIQALKNNRAPSKIQLGKALTRGLGAGADPSIGQRSVEESRAEVAELLDGCDMVFVTAGMGGGTGTGGAPVIASIAKERGALVIGIVSKPFEFEGKRRVKAAEQGIEELRLHVDALIVVPNQKLLSVADRNMSARQAFDLADDVLYNATRGIADIISSDGHINVDFADVRTVMKGMGDALMGIGFGTGENRAMQAANNAMNSPLLEGVSIRGAKGVLVNIAAHSNLGMVEMGEAITMIEEIAGDDVNLITGLTYDDSLEDKVVVTIIATGFNSVANSLPQSQVAYRAADEYSQREIIEEAQEKMVGNSSFYNRGYMPVGTGSPITVRVQEPSPESSVPFAHVTIPSERPVGHNQLSQFDKPSFMRRSGSIKLDETPSQESTDVNSTEKPAFLRKIMD